ncbi:helix-turn-helix domain-containing protein [Enterococcus faecalis]|uniref:helix-turn-helix domain-containing protein n=1 Tax=Enterococcus faecalis TaxID=1351 RepID=UPI00115B1205|nr:helix-turn-helix domain-containing protein [Enterococcus faecalis]EGO2632609.1 helix-turn-helix domain-containing protein [Enterococcus faecalis]EGO5036450.1 helix-turn-helix domain-containing protein [Enterococcus faecalis]EGO7700203.1 helix-turn-helix domain-containing protein [Enterococcus faecalis]EGO8067873.1 helix-turn-helix domain-containing protein [Enterococcus faecalis]EGO8194663.1 helix-turn-helix domain-containing protein [Enterococcus faecalis]
MDEYAELTKLIIKAQKGDTQAMTQLFQRFEYLLVKLSKDTRGSFDEDCYQILSERFIKAVRQFDTGRI